MKWVEAEKQGFSFTGSTWKKWDKTDEDFYKAKAAELKKKYKGVDYRIVTDTSHSWLGSNSKAIMGNELYLLVDHYNEEYTKKQIDNYELAREMLIEKHKKELEKLEQEHNELLEKYNKMENLKK